MSILSNNSKEDLTLKHISTLPSTSIASYLIDIPTQWPDLTAHRHNKIIKRALSSLPKSEESLLPIDTVIEWSEEKGKVTLSYDLKSIKCEFLFACELYSETLELIEHLLVRMKEIDDRPTLVNLFSLRSRVLYTLGSLSKAKSALASARSYSAQILIDPYSSSIIDMLSGMYLCDSGEYSGALSYFTESLESFSLKHREEFITVVLYIVLTHIRSGRYSEIDKISKHKKVSTITGESRFKDLLNIRVATEDIELNKYKELLSSGTTLLKDGFIRNHLLLLYNELLDRSILKIIKPYKSIYLKRVASKLGFTVEETESKVRAMLLEGKIAGIIDRENMVLVQSCGEINREDVDLKRVCEKIMSK